MVAPTPFATTSYLTEWIAVLDRVRAMGATVLVPGHGPIFHDFRYVDDLRALLGSVVQQVRAAVDAGVPKDQVPKHVDLTASARRFAGDDPFLALAFQRYFAEPAVDRAYQEATGKLEDE